MRPVAPTNRGGCWPCWPIWETLRQARQEPRPPMHVRRRTLQCTSGAAPSNARQEPRPPMHVRSRALQCTSGAAPSNARQEPRPPMHVRSRTLQCASGAAPSNARQEPHPPMHVRSRTLQCASGAAPSNARQEPRPPMHVACDLFLPFAPHRAMTGESALDPVGRVRHRPAVQPHLHRKLLQRRPTLAARRGHRQSPPGIPVKLRRFTPRPLQHGGVEGATPGAPGAPAEFA